MHQLNIILKAAVFAAEKHSLQRRKSTPIKTSTGGQRRIPYINHPLGVADLIANVGGVTDTLPLCAAILHDTVEDTDTTHEELVAVFGQAIADVVAEVSDDKTLPKQRRKQLQIEHAAHGSNAAKLVKLGDKISNVTDLLNRPPNGWDAQRIREYFDWSKKVIDAVRGTNAALEAHFDALYARRP